MKANQIIAVLLSLEPNPNVICSQERENAFLWRTARKSSRPFWPGRNIEKAAAAEEYYMQQTAQLTYTSYFVTCTQSVFLRRQNLIDLNIYIYPLPYWSNFHTWNPQNRSGILLHTLHCRPCFAKKYDILQKLDFQVSLTVSEPTARSTTGWPEAMRCSATSSTMQLFRRRTTMRCSAFNCYFLLLVFPPSLLLHTPFHLCLREAFNFLIGPTEGGDGWFYSRSIWKW